VDQKKKRSSEKEDKGDKGATNESETRTQRSFHQLIQAKEKEGGSKWMGAHQEREKQQGGEGKKRESTDKKIGKLRFDWDVN